MVDPGEMHRLGVLRDKLVEQMSSCTGFRGAGIQSDVDGGRLLLYVASLDSEAAKMAPATVDGVAVKIEVVGSIRLY